MKRFFIVLMLVVIVPLFGVAGCKIDTDLQQFVIDTGIEFAGYEIGKADPDIIDKALKYCSMLENGTLEQAALEAGIDYLMENFGGHPVLGSRMMKISGYVTVDGGVDMDKALELMPAFRDGLELAKTD